MSTAFPNPEIIGIYKKFGAFGVLYQILKPAQETEKGWMVDIEVTESGERLEYSLEYT